MSKLVLVGIISAITASEQSVMQTVRDAMLSEAMLRIAPLKDVVEFDTATG